MKIDQWKAAKGAGMSTSVGMVPSSGQSTINMLSATQNPITMASTSDEPDYGIFIIQI